MSRLTRQRLELVGSGVQGTCSPLEFEFNSTAEYYEFGFEYDDLTPLEEVQLNDYIDNLYFLCEGCGWWCETSERVETDDGTALCNDCGEENDE